jgi:hypothetical protein
MSIDVRRRAFDPFFTTRREQGSTGLGLHIVHTIVTNGLGGRLHLDSEPGTEPRYTSFCRGWRLPTCRTAAPRELFAFSGRKSLHRAIFMEIRFLNDEGEIDESLVRSRRDPLSGERFRSGFESISILPSRRRLSRLEQLCVHQLPTVPSFGVGHVR